MGVPSGWASMAECSRPGAGTAERRWLSGRARRRGAYEIGAKGEGAEPRRAGKALDVGSGGLEGVDVDGVYGIHQAADAGWKRGRLRGRGEASPRMAFTCTDSAAESCGGILGAALAEGFEEGDGGSALPVRGGDG